MASAADQSERVLTLYRGLVEVSAMINAISDFDALIPAILDVARRVIAAEAGSLFLQSEDGDSLEMVAARGGMEVSHISSRQSRPRMLVPKGKGVVGWVYEHSQPALVPDAYEDPRFYREADAKTGFKTRSILCVPLRSQERTIGVLQLLNPKDRPTFDDQDLEVLQVYANLAAAAMTRVRNLEEQRAAERLARELALASEIQRSLLPRRLPALSTCVFAARYFPARNIGGDFYEVASLDSGDLYFAIGDIFGKGVPAALGMAQCLGLLRLVLRPGLSVGEGMTLWNKLWAEHSSGTQFGTAVLGRLAVSGRLELASAGHPDPLRVRRDGQTEILETLGGPPLAVIPNQTYESTTTAIEPGETIILYTDGLTESFSPRRAALGVDALIQAIAQRTKQGAQAPDGILDGLIETEERHRAGGERSDDLTLEGMTFRGANET
jgi:sigma-B regulation protein RsbU (phosphoserine phosphatase)